MLATAVVVGSTWLSARWPFDCIFKRVKLGRGVRVAAILNVRVVGPWWWNPSVAVSVREGRVVLWVRVQQAYM
jgi:hypothetical protein